MTPLTEPGLHALGIADLGRRLRSGDLTATGLTEHFLERIAAIDPTINAFVTVTAERARADAARADRDLAAGRDRGPLHGIPYGLKDIFETAGLPTTCQSKIMRDHISTEDAFVETKLKAAGAVLLGKLATHEFALGGPSWELPFPPARNPWNTDHFTGASSTGSGAAVAAGLVCFALGSDTSGSVRGPACHCGTFGLKPTYGLVSRRGAFPLSYALDHIGPLAWTAEDTALVLEAIAGFDPLDPASVDRPAVDYTSGIGQGVAGLRIAYPRGFFAEGCDVEVLAGLDRAAALFTDLGAGVREIELPDFSLFNACGRTIMIAEGYTIHENDLRTRPQDYGRYTYQRLVMGAAITAADLVQAHRLRRELAIAVDRAAFRDHDVMLTACTLAPPVRLDVFPAHWPPPKQASATHTIPFNVTGHPALSVPAGFTADGLPIGLQLVGRAFDEATLFRVADAHERVQDPSSAAESQPTAQSSSISPRSPGRSRAM
ncbi:MAG: amidase [Alphaproteobacteria bacterium]|nr:amidase [Alphaproteobacteria bacterium]